MNKTGSNLNNTCWPSLASYCCLIFILISKQATTPALRRAAAGNMVFRRNLLSVQIIPRFHISIHLAHKGLLLSVSGYPVYLLYVTVTVFLCVCPLKQEWSPSHNLKSLKKKQIAAREAMARQTVSDAEQSSVESSVIRSELKSLWIIFWQCFNKVEKPLPYCGVTREFFIEIQ